MGFASAQPILRAQDDVDGVGWAKRSVPTASSGRLPFANLLQAALLMDVKL
jgi:hypothetical protein